jgi:hypothetical protein
VPRINIIIIGSRDDSSKTNSSKVRGKNVAVPPRDDESSNERDAQIHQDEADYLESML